LARNLHPDRHASGSSTERQLADRRMREVNAAWAVLGDASAKTMYDTELRLADQRAAASGSKASGNGTTGTRSSASGPRPTVPRTPASERPVGARTVHHRFDGVPIDDGEPDEVELSRAQVFLLRRVPVLVGIAILLAIFIGSAVATRREDVPPTGSTTMITAVGPTGASDE